MVKTKRGLIAALIAVIWAITAVLFLIPQVSVSAETVGAFEVTGGINGDDYSYDAQNHVLTVNTAQNLSISNTDKSKPTTDTIVVKGGVSANITLAGVNIDVSGTGGGYAVGKAAFKIEDDSTGNVTITLADGSTNILKSGKYCAGLQKNGLYDIGNLTVQGGNLGTGTLTAEGGSNAAGIGGGENEHSSNITIIGGIVAATGGSCGAGIGGGAGGMSIGGYGLDITIKGGIVTATGGWRAAGIGGGLWSGASNIIISGGSVKATAGTDANAIGGGKDGNGSVIPTDGSGKNVYLLELPATANTLTIDGKAYPTNHGTDGYVYVYLTEDEHTIVSDGNSSTKMYLKKLDNTLEAIGSDLKITGDSLVYGTDYTYPASTGVLTILSDKKVTISGSTTKDTIVVDKDKNANITLDGVDIDVSKTTRACAFKIEDDSTGNVTITLADGSVNVLKSGKFSAGLQKNGSGADIGKLTVSGTGKLTAIGGKSGAGIGSGISGSGSNITIRGGNITANGGVDGAGIGGGGSYNSGSNITISGGTVTATGKDGGAGIGGGYKGSGSNITISGGTVTATGGYFGAGIGGGRGSNGSDITISGGTVTATGEYYGAGIGGGISGSGSNIIISGGSVKAIAGSRANAIGGGYGYGAVTPTLADKTTPVYLLEIDNPDGKNITINDSDFTPISHGDEKKVYAYLPAKTVADPCIVTVGENISKYYYNTANNKWYGITDIPDADDTVFTYNGKEQTYTIPESSYYIVTGNKQKNAGAHTVTVALNENYSWSDGTTEDKEYTFTIAKAEPTVTVTAKPTSDIAGKTVTVTASAVNPENTALDDIPDIVLTYKIGDGAETPFTDSFVIPEDTAIGTVITVKAKTAEDGNYKVGEAETTVTVSDCAHNDVNAKWESDSTGHWHICNHCSEKVDFAAHTFDNGVITTQPTSDGEGVMTYTCTVCGYTRTETVERSASAFVERLYSSLLGRPSDETGKADWVNDLNSGVSAAQAASGFVLSEELKNQNLSNEEFIDRMYRTFLGREADAAGKADWVGVLDSGCSYAYILNSFAGSQEFNNLCDSYGITAGSYESSEPRDRNINLTSFVSRMYTEALGRAFDADGLNDWTGSYLSGQISANDIAYGIILSPEFENRHLSNEQYVDTLYRTFFGREADEGGKADWLSQLENGASRKDVLDGFLGAQEFINLKAGFGV